ncbi:MAG: ribonuclease P protein component [Alphaproteobacteria bacterium]|nr:MAG: ribonuclease P protein component [Alphaproteobacteria bacterium]
MSLSRSFPRLKKRADFLRVARGRKAARPGLVLQRARQTTSEEADGPQKARVGFTASRKVGNAVARARAKRRLRAAAQEVLRPKALPGYDYVLIGREATLTRSFPELLDDLEKALQMISNPRSPNRRKEPKP